MVNGNEWPWPMQDIVWTCKNSTKINILNQNNKKQWNIDKEYVFIIRYTYILHSFDIATVADFVVDVDGLYCALKIKK